MKHLGQKLALLLGLLTVGACGPLSEGTTAAELGALVTSRVAGQVEQPQQVGSVASSDEILANPGKYMRVSIRNIDRWDTTVQSGENGRRVTWVDSANISLTLENGLVVATRGLPRDLMAADVSQSVAAIRARGGTAQRQHEFLSDQDQISTEVLQCRIVSKGIETITMLQTQRNSTRFEEVCSGEGLQFTNVYWVNDAGSVIRSLQAVSPEAGYLQIDAF